MRHDNLSFVVTRASSLPTGLVTQVNACAALVAALFLVTFSAASSAHADSVYVYRGHGGVIKFSSRPPPSGVKAEVFTSKGRYSKATIIRVPRGRLFLDHFSDLIEAAGRTHGVEQALIRAVIHAESAFNPRAVSPKGALGLMQLMPDTARMYGVRESFEPSENIDAGVRHLAMLERRFRGDLRLVLAAYNAGEGAVAQYGGVPPFQETRQYVERVISLTHRYREAAARSGSPATLNPGSASRSEPPILGRQLRSGRPKD